jgi:hypothetical protein
VPFNITSLLQHTLVSGPSPLTVSLPRPTIAGTGLIAFVSQASSGAPGSSLGGSWVLAVQSSALGNPILECFDWLNNPGGLTSFTVTTAGGADCTVEFQEWKELAALDVAAQNSGNSLAPSITGASMLQPTELGVACFAFTTPVNPAAPVGWTTLDAQSQAGKSSQQTEYQFENAIITPSATLALSTAQKWAAVLATFTVTPRQYVLPIHSSNVYRTRLSWNAFPHIGQAYRVRRTGGTVAIEVLRPGDTPAFEIDTYQSDGQTALTAISVTVTVTNLQSKAVVSGTPTTAINPGKITVIIPASMTAQVGRYQADVKIQFDPLPGYKTVSYVYDIEKSVP